MTKYLVIFEKTKTGFSAYVPDLPGCIATGKTKSDTETRIFEAIRFHLEGMKEEGKQIPKSTTESEVLVFSLKNFKPHGRPINIE
jgi:predicted RNase H-like HicB family nuclease